MSRRLQVILINQALAFFFLLSGCYSVNAQDILVRGGFLSDSVKIGEETAFFLAADYPAELNILFPDSTFKFTPFEFQQKKFTPTVTKNGRSYDSTVYYLATFEIDSIQSLSLPVYLLQQGDCTIFLSNTDRVNLIELVDAVPDSISTEKLPLLASVNYHNVDIQLNVIIIAIVAASVIIVSILTWLFFGKRIRRYFRARKLQRLHRDFISSYDNIVKQVRTTFSAAAAESALATWKRYMEQLEGKPYTKLTTRETLILQKDETLGNNLRNIDRAIYGHNSSVNESLDHLKKVATDRFMVKIKEVKHGK
jgi:hypothetical protein